MSIPDILSLAYMGYGAVRGLKRGLAREVSRLVQIGGAFIAGCGLYDVVGNLLDAVLPLGRGFAGLVAFVATGGGVWALIYRFRRLLESWLTARLAKAQQAIGGLIAGVSRAIVIVAAAFSAANLSPVQQVRTAVVEKSFIGRALQHVLPGGAEEPEAEESAESDQPAETP